MKLRLLISITAIAFLMALTTPLQLAAQNNQDSQQANFITFDVPVAGTGAGQGTFGFAIDPSGAITGAYLGRIPGNHGFLRASDGAITTFDVPGVGRALPEAINPLGEITGLCRDGNLVFHGFLRAPDGTITTFDVPAAGTGPNQGTFSFSINPKGEIAGEYRDASFVRHGFVRAPDGTITTFDGPGAGTGPGQGTHTAFAAGDGLTPDGAVVGSILDASNVWHGFLRDPDGIITTFDIPGAGTGPFHGTFSNGINPAGTIYGIYADANNVFHGFVRAADRTITTFDVPGGGHRPWRRRTGRVH